MELKPRAAMREADAVVVGRLVEVVPRGEYTSEFRYEVKRAYKGGRAMAPGNAFSVLSASVGSACGLPTELERHYGLFLSRDRDGVWHGSSCASMGPRRLAAALRTGGHARSAAGCAS